LKQWVRRLLEQFADESKATTTPDLTEERATLLYILDIYNKHIFDIENHPVRKVREILDDFGKSLLSPNGNSEATLFKLRQFFSSYRIDEYTYIQKTFDDFKNIIWDFADQLGEDAKVEKADDDAVEASLAPLREAVESNSIDALRAKSRQFIDFYIQHQAAKDVRRTKRIQVIRRNLNSVKKKLVEANQNMRIDHLTSAFNRKSFDEHMETIWKLFNLSKNRVSLVVVDIDHFKKVNDCYGHDIGDFVIKECVGLLKQVFNRDVDFVARLGGEEFAIIMPEIDIIEASKRADAALDRIRREAIIVSNLEIRFTVSMGIAQLMDGETPEQWYKRADSALYLSKNAGRDRYTIAPFESKKEHVA
jgi:diguanylate cyclase